MNLCSVFQTQVVHRNVENVPVVQDVNEIAIALDHRDSVVFYSRLLLGTPAFCASTDAPGPLQQAQYVPNSALANGLC